MKKLFFTLLGLILFSTASNAQTDQNLIYGIEYYETDDTVKQIKMAYHYTLKYTFTKDWKTGETKVDPNPTPVKNGPCILYRIDGTMEASGQYSNDKMSGVWIYYDASGKNVIRTDTY